MYISKILLINSTLFFIWDLVIMSQSAALSGYSVTNGIRNERSSWNFCWFATSKRLLQSSDCDPVTFFPWISRHFINILFYLFKPNLTWHQTVFADPKRTTREWHQVPGMTSTFIIWIWKIVSNLWLMAQKIKVLRMKK